MAIEFSLPFQREFQFLRQQKFRRQLLKLGPGVRNVGVLWQKRNDNFKPGSLDSFCISKLSSGPEISRLPRQRFLHPPRISHRSWFHQGNRSPFAGTTPADDFFVLMDDLLPRTNDRDFNSLALVDFLFVCILDRTVSLCFQRPLASHAGDGDSRSLFFLRMRRRWNNFMGCFRRSGNTRDTHTNRIGCRIGTLRMRKNIRHKILTLQAVRRSSEIADVGDKRVGQFKLRFPGGEQRLICL